MQYKIALFPRVSGVPGDLFLGSCWNAVSVPTSQKKVIQYVLLITIETFRVE